MIPLDKQLHWLVGACMVLALATVLPLWLCLLLAFSIAAGKEWLYDARQPLIHTVDFMDFAFTCAGAIAATGWILITPTLKGLA